MLKLLETIKTETEPNNKPDVPVTVYSMVISAYLETGEHSQALEIITNLEAGNTPVDSSVYETFITALGFAGTKDKEPTESNTVEKVVNMVEHMKARGLEPSITAYKQLLNNLINQHKTDKAAELLTSLCNTMREVDVNLFTSLVQAYCSNEEPDKALGVVNLMKKVGVLPNNYLATALIFCLVRTKQFDKAWDIVAWAKSGGLDIIGFGDIIQSAQKKDFSIAKINQ